MNIILAAIEPYLPVLSTTALPVLVLLPLSWLLRPRGAVVAAHRLGTWHSVPASVVLDRLDHERHTGELPRFELVPYPQRWLAEDWRRSEVSA